MRRVMLGFVFLAGCSAGVTSTKCGKLPGEVCTLIVPDETGDSTMGGDVPVFPTNTDPSQVPADPPVNTTDTPDMSPPAPVPPSDTTDDCAKREGHGPGVHCFENPK